MNKHITQIVPILLALLLIMSGSSLAQDMHAGHAMDHSAHQGMTTIRETMVGNHHLVYNLIDMRARMKDMENMPAMENTHHLMVYFHPMGGHTMDKANVGFLITTPDSDKQRAMAMAMGGGYGADINLEKKGTYKISVKAVSGDTDIRDSFEYEVK